MSNFVTVSQIARKAKISARLARARLRKAYDDPTRKRLPTPVTHWVFREKDVDRVLRIVG